MYFFKPYLLGEFYFSDVYADRRIPEDIRNDPILYGECLGGALYIGVSVFPIIIIFLHLSVIIGNLSFFDLIYVTFIFLI